MENLFDEDNTTSLSVRELLATLTQGLPSAAAWVLCEPVELISGKQDVVCLGNAHLDFAQEEADAVVATINAYWEGTGRQLYAVSPLQWVMALSEPIMAETKPLREALNRPVGALSAAWDKLFTETQMLLQGHAVNRARSGVLPPINGLWFSVG